MVVGPLAEGSPRHAPDVMTVAIAGVAPLAAVLLFSLPVPSRLGSAVFVLMTTALVVALLSVQMRLRRARARSDASDRWAETLFERSGVSLWREDWTAARDEIERLMRSGVHDVGAYYEERPEEKRALRRRIVIKDVNQFAVAMMQAQDKSSFVGSLDRILPDTDGTFVEWLIAFANGDPLYRSETHIVRPDGTALDCFFTAALPRSREDFADIVVSALDITAYKAAQERLAAAELSLARAQRISALGALTATLAHEVNSPLAAIMANADAARRWLDRPTPELAEATAALDAVTSAADRASAVVRRNRTFLSNSSPELVPSDVAELAREATLLVEHELRSLRTAVHFDAATNLPPVMADPLQLQQVIVNLVLNGAQAMRNREDVRDLTLTVRGSEEEVVVRVTDVGCGVADADRPSIFLPFFSTRPGGLGMGLAICQMCVEGLGGTIRIEEGADEVGTTFVVRLPTARDQLAGGVA